MSFVELVHDLAEELEIEVNRLKLLFQRILEVSHNLSDDCESLDFDCSFSSDDASTDDYTEEDDIYMFKTYLYEFIEKNGNISDSVDIGRLARDYVSLVYILRANEFSLDLIDHDLVHILVNNSYTSGRAVLRLSCKDNILYNDRDEIIRDMVDLPKIEKLKHFV